MPRIALALGFVATISICIGINTYRYPMVRDMVAATPQFRLPPEPFARAGPSSESVAAADTSRSAPASAPAPAAALSSGPKPSWRPDAPAASAEIEPTEIGSIRSRGQEPGGSIDAVAPSPPGMGKADPAATSPPVAADQAQPAPPAITPSVAEPTSKYASLARSGPASGGATGERPLAPLAPLENEPSVKLPTEQPPAWKAPTVSAAPGDQMERLPPTDQVWGSVPAIPPPVGTRIVIYPSTGK